MIDVNWPVEVVVLRGDETCPESPTCPHLLDLGDPEHLHFIGTPEDRAALVDHPGVRGKMGPGEVLYRWPRRVGLPEVSPA